MAHLTDMEELLATIESASIRDYMQEAMNCYMASAYRGCIVLSYIALFDDLLAKLTELGKVNTLAKDISSAALQKQSDQDIFEKYLIDQLSSKKLLAELDVSFLDTLRSLRNKSAHPSGHKPSAEEARFIFFEVINRFLSRPILTTTQLVDELISRLKNDIFFPNNQINDIKTVIEEETALLHAEAIPQLIEKVTKAAIDSDKTVSKNAGFFLTGLAALNDPEINKELQARVIQKKSDDQQYSNILLRQLTSNGGLIIGLSDTCLHRIKLILTTRIKDVEATINETQFSHPTAVFVSLISSLDEIYLLEVFEDELKALFENHPYSNYLLKSLRGRQKIFNLYFSYILKKAGSSTFAIANKFITAAEEIDKKLSTLMSEKQAFEVIVAILQAAQYGAFSSEGMKKTKFTAIPEIRKKAIFYIDNNQNLVNHTLKEKLSIEIDAADFSQGYLHTL